MFPSLPAARQDFTDAELQALLRQPPAHYQPLPTDPLHDAAKILRVVVSTYQSVSGAGKALRLDWLKPSEKGK